MIVKITAHNALLCGTETEQVGGGMCAGRRRGREGEQGKEGEGEGNLNELRVSR